MPEAGARGAEDPDGPEGARLQRALDRLGPDWDETRVLHAPVDETTVAEVAQHLPHSMGDPESHKRARLRPTGGWWMFLLPFLGVGFIVLGVVLMGVLLADPATGSLLIAGGILLVVLALLGRGRRVEEQRRRRRVEEILLCFDLEPSARREAFLQQVELVRDAKRELEVVRSERRRSGRRPGG